jgi:hypothetical protein
MTKADSSASDVADRLRAVVSDPKATQQLMTSLYAEQLELRHVPPLQSDGPIASGLLVEISQREVAAAEKAFSDRPERTSDITVEGDGIRVRSLTRGQLRDGSFVEMRSNTLFTVKGGVIVGLMSDMDPASMTTWARVLSAGGFKLRINADSE